MAKKKKKDEIVATVGLDGSIVKSNNNKQNKNIVATVGLDGSIAPITREKTNVSNNGATNNQSNFFTRARDNINQSIAQAITQGTFENDFRNTGSLSVNNSKSIAPIANKQEEQYLDTGKKYGDYFYYDYENKKDNKIYKKGNNYYLYDDRTKSYTDINQATNRLSDKKIEKEQLEKAKKLGYKEQERKTTKEYDKANSVFKKLQKQYKLSDKELQNFIDKGTLSQKHVSLVTNSMSNLARQATEYREDIKKGKIKQYDDTVLSISDRLDLDTKGLTKKQKKEFEQDLLRQQKAKDNQYRGVRYGYDGTLKGTLQALTSTKERAADKISREIVAPINNIKENYEYGKKNNQLALEYYKKMEGKKNKADKLNKETELYNYFNKDLATNPGWAGTAIQNANTQVESIKKQGIAASILSGVGAVVGTVVEPGAGTVAGAKAGASLGYTLGSTPYTYKLEAGNQYKELLDMGVPDKIAKKHSKRVGAINAAIESGENVVDLLTFNLGGSSKAIPKETVKDLVDEYGDKQVKSWLRKSLGDKVADSMVTAAKSYGQNIVSESIEEMSQEGASIAGERLAANEGGVKRDKTVKDDLKRILQAGSSAAISTAFTAPISSLGGAIAHNTVANLQEGINNKISPVNNTNDIITQETINNEKYSKQIAPTILQYQETDNQQINNFRQSAVNEGMINSKKTQDLMNLVENVIKDKNYNILFDSTITNTKGESVNGKISLNENGQTDIRLNPNSDRAAEFLLTHEITHAIETKELRGLILNFAKKNTEFQTSLQDLHKIYNPEDVSDEVVADISAQVLGNQEFINSLQEQNTPQSKNVIKNIYESIKRLLNKMTSKGRYRNFVQDLETKWRDAYRVATNETTKNNLQKIEKYSKVYNNDGTVNRIRINDNVFEGSKDKSISKTIKDYLTKHIGEVYTIIESGQKVYLGEDLPNEYVHSEYTKKLPLSKKLAKGRAATNLNEIIENATNRTWEANKKEKHKIDAKYGFYRYDTTFSFDYNGSEKIYNGTILIRNDANGKKYLYDILNIKSQKKLANLPLVASNSNKSSAINSGSSNQSANNIPQSNKNVKSDISTKYSMQSKGNNTQELDNSSFSYRGSHQIENAKSIIDLDLKDIENKIIDIDGYLTKQSESDLNKLKKILKSTNDKVKIYRASPVNELNNGDWVTTDKSYAQNVADNNGGKVYTFEVKANQLYYPDNIRELPSLHRLSSFQYVKNTDNNVIVDNKGRKLTKEQQEFFKDSKARDEKDNLVTVYHTTTDAIPQFNEFNPVGTQYYRFGDQVVNYYTDSKDMSGSYASQDYKMADTKKLNNIEGVKKYLNHLGKLIGNDYNISKTNGLYIVSQDKQISKEARGFILKLSENEKQQMLDNIYEDKKMEELDPNYSRVFSWNYFDKELQSKYKKLTEKYLGTADTVAIQQEVMKYLESPVLLHEDSRLNGEVVGTYETEEELLKNIKTDLQKQDWSKNTKLQYEGYVNITNPYIIDAEKRNWNQVIQQSNGFIDELEERVPDNIKNNLTRLYNESANKSAEARENYETLEQVIRQGINGYQSAVDEEIQKANQVVKKVGFNEIEQILNDTQNIGVNPWYNIAEALQDEGVIGSATKTFIIDEFKLPKQVKEWLQENYNKGIPLHQIPTNNPLKLMEQLDRNATPSLKDIYNKNAQNYEEFDKYRMPNSYFIEQISAEGADYLGNELEDMFETRAEIKGAGVVGEEIAQAASVSFSKPELIRLWGTSKTTNDVVKEVIASNKDGLTNYDGVIIKNVYDFGGISSGETTPNDLYVTFNSNQFKAADNENPTNDPDIRYSRQNDKWQEHLEKNYKSTGTKTYFDEMRDTAKKQIAPIHKEIKTLSSEIKELKQEINSNKQSDAIKAPIANNYEIEDINHQNTEIPVEYNSSIDDKSLTKLSRNIRKELDLNNNQANELKKVIKEYISDETINKNSLYEDIKNKFGEKSIKTKIQEVQDVKRDIANVKLRVPQEVKNGITDFYDLKQRNFRKVNMGSEGQSIDSFYDDISSRHPEFFDEDILTDTDRLLKIIDVANLDSYYNETFTIPDSKLQEVTDYVYDSMYDYRNSERAKAAEQHIKDMYKVEKARKQPKKEKNTTTYDVPKKLTHKEVKQQLLKDMNITAQDLSIGKDISAMNYQLTDPIRVNEKVFGWKLGKKINEETIEKTKHNNAEKTRWLNSERNDIKSLGIKPRSKESAAVQKYGEKQYVTKNNEIMPYGDHQLASEFPNVKTQEKIKRAAQMIRNKYDSYIDQINNVLTSLGYDEIPKRKDYMRHFQELGDVFSKTGVPFNLNDMKAEDLPTDINGLTEFNKPGKNWFASAQQRYGEKTTYDAITGIDGYLEGAANLIYHTADIQRYRALSGLIRDSFGQQKGFDNLEGLTDEQINQRIKDIQNNKFSRYAAWLDEQANILAGKKGALDRGVERALGRRGYTFLNTLKKQVGSNMTGLNVRSALTNFISSTIASSKTNKLAMVKGTASTIKNMFHKDGFIDKSDFLTTRFGSDQLSAKKWQKISNAGQIFMNGSDYFTANQIVRSKYYEGLQKGMSEEEAIHYADDFGARVMGDRSQGMMPEAFNSKTLGMFTQFQLETNNQWQYMVHDSKMDFQRNSEINNGLKAGATMLFQMGQLAALSYLFNEGFQALTGSRAAFDPADIFKKLFGLDDDKDKSFEQRMKEAGSELFDAIPFASLFGSGGRMPIKEALTPFETTADYITGKKDQYGGDITLGNVGESLATTIPYYLLPTGYSQVKKTKKGLSMFSKDKEIKGSYTKSGNLRFPIADTTSKKIQAGLFGEYASSEARKYFDTGRTAFKDNKQNMYQTLNIPIDEYWTIDKNISEIRSKLKGSKKTTEERQKTYYKYIDSLDVSNIQKSILKKSIYKSYKDDDDEIYEYINKSKMSKKNKKTILKRLGLDDY